MRYSGSQFLDCLFRNGNCERGDLCQGRTSRGACVFGSHGIVLDRPEC